MKFFIDTANLAEIKEAQDLGVLDGVTTNPSLMAKEGIAGKDNIMKHYKAICDIVTDNVSAEVIATDFAGMVKEGEELAKIDPKIVVKVPMIKDGIKAIKYFSEKGIRTNCTLVFSAGQAILAAKAGATYDDLTIFLMMAWSLFLKLGSFTTIICLTQRFWLLRCVDLCTSSSVQKWEPM